MAHRLFYIIYETFKGGSGVESCGITWKSEEEFLKLGTSTIYVISETFKGGSGVKSFGITRKLEDEFLKFGTSTMYIIYFKGGSGVESCDITWKSEEEFLKLGTSTAMKKILKLGLRQPLADKKRKLPASKVESCDKNILVFRENRMDRENTICRCCTFYSKICQEIPMKIFL